MRYKDIAIAFLIEAKDDLEMAEIALRESKFSKCVFHSQQCSEKVIKSVLACERIVGILEHEVSDFLGRVEISKEWEEKIREVRDHARFLEAQGTKPRYPLYGKPELPVWIPSKEYKEGDAIKALEKAKFVLENLKSFLEENYELDIGL